MTTFFGAIADDFTGATDLAALLARSGVSASLRLGVPGETPEDTAPLEIIALKCRTAPVDEAVAETCAALDWLRKAGAQRFFWKYCSTFDSTERGNIGPVAEALMDDLGTDQTIYCPAFPENGRCVFMGNLFVGEQLLSESPMKDHPLTPMRDSNLLRLLKLQVTRPVGVANRLVVARGAAPLRDRLSDLKAAGATHVVVDAIANEDLYVIAEACQDMTLLTGGSAVAMPLPELWLKRGLLSKAEAADTETVADGPAIVLSGSCSAMTNRQVKAFLSEGHPAFRLDPLDLAESGAWTALSWLAGQNGEATPIIYATAEPDAVRAAQEKLGTERAGELVEEAQTSGAVAKALGINRLGIGAEIAPGVPWCFAQSGGHALAIALKSGNFGGDSFFTDALERLQP